MHTVHVSTDAYDVLPDIEYEGTSYGREKIKINLYKVLLRCSLAHV